jgi:hypothetical protein
MTSFPTSGDADRMLAGHLLPADLPDEAGPLAAVLAAMRNAAVTGDAEQHRRAIAGAAAEIRDRRREVVSDAGSVFGNRISRRRISPKAAGFAFAAVLLTGTSAAAAANGSLPAPVQRAVASALDHVAISVPNPDTGSTERHGPLGARAGVPGRGDHGVGAAAPSGPAGPKAAGREGGTEPNHASGATRADRTAKPSKSTTTGPATTTTPSSGSTTTTVPQGPPTSIPGTRGQHTPKAGTPTGPIGPTGGTGAQDQGGAAAHAESGAAQGS